MKRTAVALFLGIAVLAPPPGAAHELTGFIAAEYRGFWKSPLFPNQRDHQPSIVLEPEYFHEWNGGDDVITFTPFFRYDWMDSRRTHFDVREVLEIVGPEPNPAYDGLCETRSVLIEEELIDTEGLCLSIAHPF